MHIDGALLAILRISPNSVGDTERTCDYHQNYYLIENNNNVRLDL